MQRVRSGRLPSWGQLNGWKSQTVIAAQSGTSMAAIR
jgi:hypothetical protein